MLRPRRAALPIIALGLVLGFAGVARADNAPAPSATPAGADEAKRHFQQGVALYTEGNYGPALTEFEAAYRLHATPGVLYNIGLTLKALFRYNESIDMLNRYMADTAAAGKAVPPERKAETEQLISEMRALLADIILAIVPDGATVKADGRVVGSSPLKLQLPTGQHVLEIIKDGYYPERREFTVAAGTPVTMAIALRVIPTLAHVRIGASEAGASVRVDSKPLGFAPLELDLTGGGHTVEVTKDKFLTSVTELNITPGKDRRLELVLQPLKESHFYQKWWFWTAAVVVIGGGAAAIWYVTRPTEPALVGTLSPGVGNVN